MLSNNLVGTAKHIAHPKDVRLALGLSQSQMGRLLGEYHPNGHHGRAYTRGAISQWENGIYPMNRDAKVAYAEAINATVTNLTNGRMWTQATFIGRWGIRVKIVSLCRECKHLYRPVSRRNQLCPRCRG